MILFRVLPVVLGFVLIVSGVALWSVPAAMVTAGVLLLLAALVDLGDVSE